MFEPAYMRRLGAKFLRQVPIGAFIADFACLEARLIVEVDGPSHATPERQARGANGWRVVRVPNDLVAGGGEIALDRIRKALRETRRGCRVAIAPSPAPPSSDPCSRKGHLLPHAGEG